MSTFNRLLPMQDSVPSVIGYWECIGSLSYAALPTIDTFHDIISKKSYHYLSHQKSLSILGNCQAHASRHTFSKILIFIESLNFIFDSTYYQLFCLKWKSCFVHFWEMSVKYITVLFLKCTIDLLKIFPSLQNKVQAF